jgi:hypothetical protein
VRPDRGSEDVGLDTLRRGDVVVVDGGDAFSDGDYLVEGICILREGGSTTVVANMADASRRRWLVGNHDQGAWLVVEPVLDHGLTGEPPRQIRRERGDFTLARRGQASAACMGRHERPELPRAATYVYSASSHDVLWLERWGHDILMGEGKLVEATMISFLPGS